MLLETLVPGFLVLLIPGNLIYQSAITQLQQNRLGHFGSIGAEFPLRSQPLNNVRETMYSLEKLILEFGFLRKQREPGMDVLDSAVDLRMKDTGSHEDRRSSSFALDAIHRHSSIDGIGVGKLVFLADLDIASNKRPLGNQAPLKPAMMCYSSSWESKVIVAWKCSLLIHDISGKDGSTRAGHMAI